MANELLAQLDMKELYKFNPKLHDELKENPQAVLELKEIIFETMKMGDDMAESQAYEAAADDLQQQKKPKSYTLPIFWSMFAPVFDFTAAKLIKLQAFCGIPWMSFIVLCGLGVRIAILPLMIKQMTLINKMSQASPNIRLAAKLFKHSQMNIFRRSWHFFRAILDF